MNPWTPEQIAKYCLYWLIVYHNWTNILQVLLKFVGTFRHGRGHVLLQQYFQNVCYNNQNQIPLQYSTKLSNASLYMLYYVKWNFIDTGINLSKTAKFMIQVIEIDSSLRMMAFGVVRQRDWSLFYCWHYIIWQASISMCNVNWMSYTLCRILSW